MLNTESLGKYKLKQRNIATHLGVAKMNGLSYIQRSAGYEKTRHLIFSKRKCDVA